MTELEQAIEKASAKMPQAPNRGAGAQPLTPQEEHALDRAWAKQGAEQKPQAE